MSIKETAEQRFMEAWWARLAFGVIFLAVSYGFFSLAIDSAKTLEYLAAIIFLLAGIRELIGSVKALRK